MKPENSPNARQSRPVRGRKKLAAKMRITAVLRTTRVQRP